VTKVFPNFKRALVPGESVEKLPDFTPVRNDKRERTTTTFGGRVLNKRLSEKVVVSCVRKKRDQRVDRKRGEGSQPGRGGSQREKGLAGFLRKRGQIRGGLGR